MREEVRQFLNDNMVLLKRDDFKELFLRARQYNIPGTWRTENLWPEVYDVLTSNGIYPLEEMDTIPEYFFVKTNVKKLVIPRNIKKIESNSIFNSEVVSIYIENPDVSIAPESMTNLPKLQSLNFPQGMISVPSLKLDSVPELKIIRIPESVVRIKAGAFTNIPDDTVIVTPYRKDYSKKLNVSDAEIEFYKKHLRFTHAPENVEVEDEI